MAGRSEGSERVTADGGLICDRVNGSSWLKLNPRLKSHVVQSVHHKSSCCRSAVLRLFGPSGRLSMWESSSHWWRVSSLLAGWGPVLVGGFGLDQLGSFSVVSSSVMMTCRLSSAPAGSGSEGLFPTINVIILIIMEDKSASALGLSWEVLLGLLWVPVGFWRVWTVLMWSAAAFI